MNQHRERDEAMVSLFNTTYRTAVKRMYFRTRSLEDAEDIVMDAFRKATEYWGSFNSELSSINGWFERILKNSLKSYQKEKFMKHMDGDSEMEIPVEDKYIQNITADRIRDQIEALPSDDRREVCNMFFVLGYSYKEIESVLNISVRNARYYVDEFKKLVREEHEGSSG